MKLARTRHHLGTDALHFLGAAVLSLSKADARKVPCRRLQQGGGLWVGLVNGAVLALAQGAAFEDVVVRLELFWNSCSFDYSLQNMPPRPADK